MKNQMLRTKSKSETFALLKGIDLAKVLRDFEEKLSDLRRCL